MRASIPGRLPAAGQTETESVAAFEFNAQGMDQAWSLRRQPPSPLESPWMVEVTHVFRLGSFALCDVALFPNSSPVRDRWLSFSFGYRLQSALPTGLGWRSSWPLFPGDCSLSHRAWSSFLSPALSPQWWGWEVGRSTSIEKVPCPWS